jgi:hypothetical protein
MQILKAFLGLFMFSGITIVEYGLSYGLMTFKINAQQDDLKRRLID